MWEASKRGKDYEAVQRNVQWLDPLKMMKIFELPQKEGAFCVAFRYDSR